MEGDSRVKLEKPKEIKQITQDLPVIESIDHFLLQCIQQKISLPFIILDRIFSQPPQSAKIYLLKFTQLDLKNLANPAWQNLLQILT